MATAPDSQYVIYSMVRVKLFPPNREVIRDISLSFFYGAKIGVLGLNGSGKSTLLRIIAGIDKDYLGEVVRAPGYSASACSSRSRSSIRARPSAGGRGGGAADRRPAGALRRDQRALLRPRRDMDALIAEQAEVQEQLDHVDAWNLDSRLELAMDALRCPPPDTPISVLSGGERRRVALCRLLLTEPDILLLTSRPTTSTPSRCCGWRSICSSTKAP